MTEPPDSLEVLFDQAVALPPEAREVFLDSACRDDAALRAELESLLECDASTHRGDLLSKSPLVRDSQDQLCFEPPAAPGEIGILGPYRIVTELGRGGMGTVYMALDTRLDRQVALKVILPHYSADAAARRRFLREARTAAQVVHDNVITVYESDEHHGVSYIAMQLLEGCTLDEHMKEHGAPPLPILLRIARESAAGLAAAHQAGLVHRDVKPANLWLESPHGRVKVLDFGLAKPADARLELTWNGAILGTPAYMSPEQARGEPLDHRTDLFSLGAVLYRLAAGELPFAGPTTIAALTALATAEPKPLREFNPAIPESLATLIHKMLAKRADDRPSSAIEIVARLQQIGDSELSTADSLPRGARRRKRRIAERTAWMAAGLAALSLALGAFMRRPQKGAQSPVPSPLAITSAAAGPSAAGPRSPDLASSGTAEAHQADKFDNDRFNNGDFDNNRRAAEWVLSVGGFVRISQDREVKVASKLPSTRFSVTQVDLSGKSIDDNGLTNLAGLSLTHLNLYATRVTDAGLAKLAALARVNYLNLGRTAVTDEGLARLKELRGLDWLYLNETGVSDAGLARLQDVPALKKLQLNDLPITNAGLARLQGIKSLTYLNVQGTGVTKEGLQEFHAAVPACKVDHDEGLPDSNLIINRSLP
jgi:serine/threonine protein kinase